MVKTYERAWLILEYRDLQLAENKKCFDAVQIVACRKIVACSLNSSLSKSPETVDIQVI